MSACLISARQDGYSTMPPQFESVPLSDAMLAGMVAISADAIIAVNSAQRIVFYNAGAEHIFGYAATEAIGKPLADLLPSRFRAMHGAHVEQFGAAHEPARRMGERQKIWGLRSNGEEFPAEASIARVAVDDRVIYTVVLRDISARQRIEQDLRTAIESRDQMSSIVSHDLRNPVQAVKMLSSAILQHTGDDRVSSVVAEQVSVIRRAAEQIDALIEDLADVTRIESGQLRVRVAPTDPIALVELACETLYPLAAAKQQDLRVDFAESLPDVLADPDRVIQLLSNVIGNAIKFTPTRGTIWVTAQVQLTVERTEAGAFLLFVVRDSGPGIPMAHLPHVFNRYWHSAQAVRPGSGLGLTIAKGIVEAHGGWITAESVEGHGTTVRFTLPCVR